MATATTPANAASPPIRNLRILFWGVQGSCPMFPEQSEVDEYRWTVARDALKRMILNLQDTARERGVVPVKDLLDRLDSDDAIAAYQQSLGESDLPVFGGETTCAVVETSEGNVIILDGGSGIRNASKHMIRTWGQRPRSINILASHEHLDHRSGLPFCQFCFARPAFDLCIHGTRQFLKALDMRYGIYSRKITAQTYYDDPIDYRMMSARFTGYEIPGPDDAPGPQDWNAHAAGAAIHIGSTLVTPFDVYHGPTRCLGYKIQHGSATFVFCTDHELRHAGEADDPRKIRSLAAEAQVRRHCGDADLVYIDGQYRKEEYFGRAGIGATAPVPRVDWGHGCIEDAIERAGECRVKHMLIGHHDPERIWRERLELDHQLAVTSAEMGRKIELAKSDMVVDL
jgi:hypothetical protein